MVPFIQVPLNLCIHFSSSLFMQHVLPFELTYSSLRPCVTLHSMLNFLQWRDFSPWTNPHAGGTPLSSCPRLPIQHICSHPLYVRAVDFVHYLECALLWWHDPLNIDYWGKNWIVIYYCGRICHCMAFYGLESLQVYEWDVTLSFGTEMYCL